MWPGAVQRTKIQNWWSKLEFQLRSWREWMLVSKYSVENKVGIYQAFWYFSRILYFFETFWKCQHLTWNLQNTSDFLCYLIPETSISCKYWDIQNVSKKWKFHEKNENAWYTSILFSFGNLKSSIYFCELRSWKSSLDDLFSTGKSLNHETVTVVRIGPASEIAGSR